MTSFLMLLFQSLAVPENQSHNGSNLLSISIPSIKINGQEEENNDHSKVVNHMIIKIKV